MRNNLLVDRCRVIDIKSYFMIDGEILDIANIPIESLSYNFDFYEPAADIKLRLVGLGENQLLYITRKLAILHDMKNQLSWQLNITHPDLVLDLTNYNSYVTMFIPVFVTDKGRTDISIGFKCNDIKSIMRT